MKRIFLTFLLLGSGLMHAQTVNQEIEQENGKTFLLGKINLEGLQSEPYNSWFSSNYSSYAVDETLVKVFKPALDGYHVKLFLGTWCGDSKREVPRFLKILEAANFPMENLDIVALDRRSGKVKTSPTGEERGLNIIRVPTMLFYKNGKEVNRIVESPIETLEEDMAQILNGQSYTPNYATISKTK
ncbi:thioredoxin family protein [Flagellimonas myxillae]|uniref:thioredoxin family protein n=1 Tax=Flagellimonas myxillae TaxID=2942214 RepID=UPI00201F957C|nr:thioredoxin family protein [Muricauda myxillae]MCL6267840.1 thioredoxin family protein [Muricauda myxillae]